MAQPSARDHILDTAKRLFYRDGFRATGIDRIVAESGVAKMSLYRHFPSKDDLIAAFLDWRHAHWTAWFMVKCGGYIRMPNCLVSRSPSAGPSA